MFSRVDGAVGHLCFGPEVGGMPENRFAVTVKIDSAIASEPQKNVYVLDD